MLASSRENLDIVRVLIQHGANDDDRDEDGMTALLMACNVLSMERELIYADNERVTAQNVHLEIIRFLMDQLSVFVGGDGVKFPVGVIRFKNSIGSMVFQGALRRIAGEKRKKMAQL